MQTRAGNFSSRRYWRINLFCGMGYGKKQAYLTEMIQSFNAMVFVLLFCRPASRYDRRG
jgi:hypothetical protein